MSDRTNPFRSVSFSNPPLDEVVFGVQFRPPPGFLSIHSKIVWDVFRQEFPTVVEKPIIPPQFETFGGRHVTGIEIDFGSPQQGNRLWFISADETHLVQFQNDRFLLNWRKRADRDNSYPRYETIIGRFSTMLDRLAELFRTEFEHEMAINQAEVSYINVATNESKPMRPDEWLTVFGPFEANVERLSASVSEVISDGKLLARLTYEIGTALTINMMPAIRFGLTVRGAPASSAPSQAIAFIDSGKQIIIDRFLRITTAEAQKKWGIEN